MRALSMPRLTPLLAIVMLLGAASAQACNSTPASTRRTIQIGRDWVASSCGRGRDTDCVGVIQSVIRTISPLEGCPGLAPGEVTAIVQQLQAMAAEAPGEARREAKQRYEDRMAPTPYVPSAPSSPADHNNGRYGWQPPGTYCSRFTTNADGSLYCY